MKSVLTSVFIIINWVVATCQPPDNMEVILEDWITLHNTDDAGMDLSELYDELNYWINHPVDINNNTQDLDKIIFLSIQQKKSIHTHLHTYQAFIDINELLSLQYFGLVDVRLLDLILFTGLSNSKQSIEQKLGQVKIRPTHLAAFSYNRKFDPSPVNHLGSQDGITFRMRSRGESVETGVILQKDPGEYLLYSNKGYTPDYFSGFVSLTAKRKPINLIIGDYKLQFGQGLHYWNGFTPWINTLSPTIERTGRELSPYTSALETKVLRGVALSATLKSWTITPFISSVGRDAHIDDKDQTKVNYLLTSGNHRTESELAQKKNIRETLSGLRIRKSTQNGYLAGTLSYLKYNKYFTTDKAPYRQLNFSGNSTPALGIDYASYFNKVTLFGEFVVNKDLQGRFLNGLTWHLGQQLNLTGSMYHYSGQFFGPNSNPWINGSTGSNEQGINLGYSLLLFPRLNLSGFLSFYSNSSSTFRADSPSQHSKTQHQITYAFNDQITTYARITTRKNQSNNARVIDATKHLEEIHTQDFRFHMTVALVRDLKLQTQIDYRIKQFTSEQASGYLFFTSLRKSIPHWPVKIALTYSVSDGTPLSGAFYTSNATMPYEFGSVSHSSQSNHISAMIKVKIMKSISFWFRAAQRLTSSSIDSSSTVSSSSISAVLKCQF